MQAFGMMEMLCIGVLHRTIADQGRKKHVVKEEIKKVVSDDRPNLAVLLTLTAPLTMMEQYISSKVVFRKKI